MPDDSTGSDTITGKAPWHGAFRAKLMVPKARAFVDWALATGGAGIVLERHSFTPDDLKPWLGRVSVLQWESEAGDYRYRVFGSHWAEILGREFTGRTLSAWPGKIARAIRTRTNRVLHDRSPIGGHIAVSRYAGGLLRRGSTVYEHITWPLRYGQAEPDAVIEVAIAVPDSYGFDTVTLVDETGRLSRWFNADGSPFESSGDTTGTAVWGGVVP